MAMVHRGNLDASPCVDTLPLKYTHVVQIRIDLYLNYLITARKRSLRRLCFHSCLSVHRRGGVCLWSQGVCHTPWADTLLPTTCWDTHPPAQYMLGYTNPPLTSACWEILSVNKALHYYKVTISAWLSTIINSLLSCFVYLLGKVVTPRSKLLSEPMLKN